MKDLKALSCNVRLRSGCQSIHKAVAVHNTGDGLHELYNWTLPPCVYLTSPHVTRSSWPSSTILEHCKQWNTGGGEGLEWGYSTHLLLKQDMWMNIPPPHWCTTCGYKWRQRRYLRIGDGPDLSTVNTAWTMVVADLQVATNHTSWSVIGVLGSQKQMAY